MAKNNKKNDEKIYKCKKIGIIYFIVFTLALILSLTCHYHLNWNSISDFLLCFVGVSGTVASLYSIIVSVNDEIRTAKERDESKKFLDELSKSVGFVLSNTETVKSDLKTLLDSRSESNISINENGDSQKKEDETPNDDWNNPTDENPPT